MAPVGSRYRKVGAGSGKLFWRGSRGGVNGSTSGATGVVGCAGGDAGADRAGVGDAIGD